MRKKIDVTQIQANHNFITYITAADGVYQSENKITQFEDFIKSNNIQYDICYIGSELGEEHSIDSMNNLFGNFTGKDFEYDQVDDEFYLRTIRLKQSREIWFDLENEKIII